MTDADLELLAKGIAPVVSEIVEKSLAGVVGRIAALEQRAPVTGRDGRDGLAGQMGERGPVGEKGLDGQPGAQGSAGETGPMGPAGPAGEKGLDGQPGQDGDETVLRAVESRLQAIEQTKDFEPDQVASFLTSELRKALADVAPVPVTYKQIIRDARGQIVRVVDEIKGES